MSYLNEYHCLPYSMKVKVSHGGITSYHRILKRTAFVSVMRVISACLSVCPSHFPCQLVCRIYMNFLCLTSWSTALSKRRARNKIRQTMPCARLFNNTVLLVSLYASETLATKKKEMGVDYLIAEYWKHKFH